MTIKVGDKYTVEIEAVGERGDGISKINGFVIFVPDVESKKQYRIKITKMLRKVGFAEVIRKESNMSIDLKRILKLKIEEKELIEKCRDHSICHKCGKDLGLFKRNIYECKYCD